MTLDLGRDVASVTVTVRREGAVHLAFGGGEAFRAHADHLPLAVVEGARQVLRAAASLPAGLPREAGGAGGAPVRFRIETHRGVVALDDRLARLRDGRSPLAELWRAYGAMMSPLIAVVLPDRRRSGGAAGARSGIARARQLWGQA